LVIPIITMADGERWPDLDLLQDLDVLLEERHVTKAAKRRGVTQSAMSARLGKLRVHFGDRLLVDARPKLLLTPRAASLQGPLRASLRQLASTLTTRAPFDPKNAKRTFVIVGGDIAEVLAVPRLLARFRESAPGLGLQLRRAITGDLVTELGERGGDLAFAPISQASGTLSSLHILEDEFVVMMSKRHPLAGKPLTLRRYLAYPHILVAPIGLPGSLVDDALAKIGEKRNVVAVLRHFVSAPFVVAQGDTLLTCPSSLVNAVSDFLPVVTARPPLPIPSYSLRAIWHERCHDDPAHVWLRETLRASLALTPAK
jgi:DNA-binding transcriptional LysR family regulator